MVEKGSEAKVTMEEVEKALQRLKKNKAAGPDRILNEYYKELPEELKRGLQDALNEIIRSRRIPEEWKESLIPIHKSGEITDPKNYRGITLLNASYKIMMSIMNEKIKKWLEENKISKESQNGFRTGYGTRDALFTLNSIIENKLKRKGGKLFVMFLDLKAAFDKVNREKLIIKLRKIGLNEQITKIIEETYKETSNTIAVGEEKGRKFWTSAGVRQGCPLSPTLFSVYIDDLENEWER